MIKYLTCDEFIKTLKESLERTDAQTVMFNDMLGNVAFNVTEGDVVHTYYAPDASDIPDPDVYLEFAGELNQIIQARNAKEFTGE